MLFGDLKGKIVASECGGHQALIVRIPLRLISFRDSNDDLDLCFSSSAFPIGNTQLGRK